MAADPQFIEALTNLGKSVQQYGLSQAVRQANERAKEIKNQARPDMERRAMLTDLANDVMMNLSAGGATPDQIAVARASIQPPAYTSIEQMLLAGISQGDPATIQAAKELEDEQLKKKLSLLQVQTQMQEQSQARSFAQQQRLQDQRLEAQESRAAMSAQAAAERQANKPLPSSFARPLIDIRSSRQELQEIYNDMKANPSKYDRYVGPVVGRLADTAARIPVVGVEAGDAANFQSRLRRQVDQYRRVVTGAQGAFREVQRIEQTSVDPTLDYETLLNRIETLLDTGRQAENVHLDTVGAMGYNVEPLRMQQAPQPTSSAFKPQNAGNEANPSVRARNFFTPASR